MKRCLPFVVALALAALLTAPLRAANTAPEPTGTVKASTDQPTETPAEHILRLVGSNTKNIPLTDNNINWQAISGGASTGSSSSWVVSVTVGQPANGTGSSGDYTVSSGFWQQFGSGSCCVMRGDMNHSGYYSVSDLTYLVDFLARGGAAPGCLEEGDVDASNALNISDLTYLVAFLFLQGPPPPPCS